MNPPRVQINRSRLLPSLTKRLLFAGILTVAAKYFLWRHRIGISLPLYAGLLRLGMMANVRGLQSVPALWVFLLLLASSLATALSEMIRI